MKLQSCAFTASYKGYWIHQLTDGTFTWQSSDFTVRKASSWRAAQLAITRHCKKASS